MNTIWRIMVQEFAFFTVASFIEVAELGIDRQKIYNPGVSAERTDGRGFLLESPPRIRACFYVEWLCRLLHARGANVECAMHQYFQYFGVD